MSGMGRREFVALLGGAAGAWPVAVRAEGVPRIGVLVVADNPVNRTNLAALLRGLERAGWSDGRNARIDIRFAEDEQVRARAQELVALQPDVIVAHTTPAAIALQRQSRTIPIVFLAVADPIGAGLVASLARHYQDTITGKWLAMLKEIAPRLERVALVANPKTSPYDYFMGAARAVAPSLAIQIVSSPVESAVDIEGAILSLTRMMDCGLVITPDTTTGIHRDLIIALTERHRLPAVYFNRAWVSAGGLMSYGIDFPDHFLQAAAYVDRVLRGAKPTDLPVQVPTKYETVVNLRTARALGITVPPGLLVAADEVIE